MIITRKEKLTESTRELINNGNVFSYDLVMEGVATQINVVVKKQDIMNYGPTGNYAKVAFSGRYSNQVLPKGELIVNVSEGARAINAAAARVNNFINQLNNDEEAIILFTPEGKAIRSKLGVKLYQNNKGKIID